MNISSVSPQNLDGVWQTVLPMVARGLRHGQGDSLLPCDILRSIKSGDMILWVAHEEETIYGAMIFQVSQAARKRTVFVVMLAGKDFDEWVEDMESLLFDYMDAVEADCIEASCRKGMVKKLMSRGWKQKAVIMEAPHGR